MKTSTNKAALAALSALFLMFALNGCILKTDAPETEEVMMEEDGDTAVNNATVEVLPVEGANGAEDFVNPNYDAEADNRVDTVDDETTARESSESESSDTPADDDEIAS